MGGLDIRELFIGNVNETGAMGLTVGHGGGLK